MLGDASHFFTKNSGIISRKLSQRYIAFARGCTVHMRYLKVCLTTGTQEE